MQGREQGGYIGILMVLIAVAIMALVIVRTDLLTGNKNQKSMLQENKQAIDQAKAAKDMLDKRYQQNPEQ